MKVRVLLGKHWCPATALGKRGLGRARRQILCICKKQKLELSNRIHICPAFLLVSVSFCTVPTQFLPLSLISSFNILIESLL